MSLEEIFGKGFVSTLFEEPREFGMSWFSCQNILGIVYIVIDSLFILWMHSTMYGVRHELAYICRTSHAVPRGRTEFAPNCVYDDTKRNWCGKDRARYCT